MRLVIEENREAAGAHGDGKPAPGNQAQTLPEGHLVGVAVSDNTTAVPHAGFSLPT